MGPKFGNHQERGDNLRLLRDHFQHAFIATFKKPVKGLSSKTLQLLSEYSYPGNVRELMNIVE